MYPESIPFKARFSWKALGWNLLYFFFFSTLLQVLIYFSGYSGTTGIRDSLLFSSLWLIPGFLFPAHNRIIAAVTGMILWATSLVALNYYVIYGHEFSQSVLFVMFETDIRESTEYLSQYFTLKIAFISVIYTLTAILLWTRLRPVYIPVPWRYLITSGLLYGLILHPLVVNTFFRHEPVENTLGGLASRMEPAAPWQFLSGYYQYRQQLHAVNQLLNKNSSLPLLKNLKDVSGDEPRTLVMVIGESTQRRRMSLYGYVRETTPELESLYKNDSGLTVFHDVIASRPYTIEMLLQALTFANQHEPDLYLTKPSLINLMKQAGYKTFWITNQQAMTARNTLLTMFSKQTDHQYYMNRQRTQSAREYDTNVLGPFKEVLSDPAQKKFIVVHLLGTHLKYKYRYPENYGKFDGDITEIPQGLNAKEQELYNDYDNANLFNDYVVASLIRDFRAGEANGFLLYFSDHGEEVYDTPPHNIQGRDEDKPTSPMYTIPFLLWTSENWQLTHPRDYSVIASRKYSLSDLIHTWSDLAGLSYDGYDPSRSVVSPQFKEVPRWIGNPYKKDALIDYDVLFQ